MLLFLENEQKIYRSNAQLHIFLIQNGFYINFHRRFLSLLTTYLATLTSTLLSSGTIGIVNNENILTDGSDERKYLERFIYAGNMILLLQT